MMYELNGAKMLEDAVRMCMNDELNGAKSVYMMMMCS